MTDVSYSFKKQTANSIEVIAHIGSHDFRTVIGVEDWGKFIDTLNPCEEEK